jgi:hypothetical protein
MLMQLSTGRHMDSIQEQVILLTGKIDALYQMIDQVNGKVTAMLGGAYPRINDDSELIHNNDVVIQSSSYRYSGRPGPSALDTVCEHKDILLDDAFSSLEHHTSETNLSQDVQIQRLTAQLTAAYNRIAALEEQLLAGRVH